MEARVGGVSSHGGVVEGSARKFLQQPHLQQQQQQQQHHHYYHTQQQQQQQQPQTQPQIGTVPQLLAGGIAGAFSKTCTAPLARLTILFQVQGMHSDIAVLAKPSICREALRIVNEEGFRAFWKGNLVTIAHRLPYSSVNFYAYEHFKSLLKSIPGLDGKGRNAGADAFVHFVGGGLAGITAAAATYPLDLVRTRLAAQVIDGPYTRQMSYILPVCCLYAHGRHKKHAASALIDIDSGLLFILQRNAIYYQGICHSLRTICRDEGFFGLYKGLGATLLGVGPSIAISFSVYEALRSHWQTQRPDDPTIAVSLVCGSLSGIASSTATFPLDLVRRRKQLEGAGGRARVYNTGIMGMFKHIIRTEGLRGLYRGIMPEYYKVVPSVGIVFMTYETLKKLLSQGPLDS